MAGTNRITDVTEGAWAGWTKIEPTRDDLYFAFIAPMYVRSDRRDHAIVALETHQRHGNLGNVLHGGFIAGAIDQIAFMGLTGMGHTAQIRGRTIDFNVQFMGAGQIGVPIFAETEVLKETGRMYFMRMTVRQQDEIIAAATATLKKGPRQKPE